MDIQGRSREELIEKVLMKKQYSEIPLSDVEKVFDVFDDDLHSDEEKVKKTRDLLRKIYSGFSGKKLFNWKNKTADQVLKKHSSTKERFDFYDEIYERLLKNFKNKKISVIDLGAGVNGFSYGVLKNSCKSLEYVGVEAVGQFVELMNIHFSKEKLKAKAYHKSLFQLDAIKEIVKSANPPRIVFMFKVVDSLEMVEKNYTKKLLLDLKPLVDRFVVSFATASMVRHRRFFVKRYWFTDFLNENFNITDDFEVGDERYLVFDSSSVGKNKFGAEGLSKVFATH